MDPQTRFDRQHVFSAYRDIFAGKNAFIRKNKAIRSVVLRHSPTPKDSASELHVDQVVFILKSLLTDRVFECEEQASRYFPGLFPEPPQSQRAGKPPKRRKTSPGKSIEAEHILRTNNVDRTSQECLSEMPAVDGAEGTPASLVSQPFKFPYNIQHRILSMTQQILEESCFGFTKLWLPSLLKKRGWNCAAAVELTKWLHIIKTHLGILPTSCMSTAGQALFKKHAPIVTQLRHAAVHRVHLRSDQFLEQIHSAQMLAEALQDSRSAAELQNLYAQVDVYVSKMNHDTEAIKQEADSTLLWIHQKREALHKRELLLQKSIAQQQIDIPVAAGQALIESLNRFFVSHEPNTAAEIQSMMINNENARHNSCTVAIDEAYIESDEDQLRAEL